MGHFDDAEGSENEDTEVQKAKIVAMIIALKCKCFGATR